MRSGPGPSLDLDQVGNFWENGNVSHSSFFYIVWDFTGAVLRAPELKLRMPLWDAAGRSRTAAGFESRWNIPLDNIIGALGDVAVRLEQPSVSDITCPKDY